MITNTTVDTPIESQLLQSAKALLCQRYPSGWGGAAALATSTGKILTSVAPEVKNDALSLCIEVGACLEAYKLNERVTHALCIYRYSATSQITILTPCGICQERLLYWGNQVLVAISNSKNELQFKTLKELMPHHWSLVNEQ